MKLAIPPTTDVATPQSPQEMRRHLTHWINERWSIQVPQTIQPSRYTRVTHRVLKHFVPQALRSAGAEPPWTEDKVLASVRFCNVRREDDAVTRWIRVHWNSANDPCWRFVLGRLINWPDSLAEIVTVGRQGGMSMQQARQALKDRQLRGCKVFTSAYVIPAGSVAGVCKIDHIFDVVTAVANGREPPLSSLADCASSLQQQRGIGLFLSGQVVADMKNTASHPLANAHDWFSWSSPGPGSCRGLSWYFTCSPDSASSMRSSFHSMAAIARSEVQPLLHPSVSDMCAQDFQNCLCEFSKWCKATFLGGRARNSFNANGARSGLGTKRALEN